jgi:hypothetical protein
VTVLIGYVPTAVGEAALEQGLAEADLTGDEVVILNSPRRGATVDSNQIDEEAAAELVKRSAAAGVTARVESIEHGADIVEAFEDVVRVTGARMRSGSGQAGSNTGDPSAGTTMALAGVRSTR